MSNFITAESALHAQRWDVPMFEADTVPAPPPHSARHLDALEQQAFEEGHARGYRDGREQGRAAEMASLQAEAQRLAAICDHLAAPLKALDGEIERMLVLLAIDVGSRLALQALGEHPEAVAEIVREALQALGNQRVQTRIHLHPADARLLADTLQVPAEVSDWRLLPDAELQRGDCVVTTDLARVDARLDIRAASLAQTLLGERASA